VGELLKEFEAATAPGGGRERLKQESSIRSVDMAGFDLHAA